MYFGEGPDALRRELEHLKSERKAMGWLTIVGAATLAGIGFIFGEIYGEGPGKKARQEGEAEQMRRTEENDKFVQGILRDEWLKMQDTTITMLAIKHALPKDALGAALFRFSNLNQAEKPKPRAEEMLAEEAAKLKIPREKLAEVVLESVGATVPP